jgi:hypothetical protein
VDDVTWGALTLTLTVVGALWTWLSFRRRGVASGLRALAFTLLPLAAYLTQTLQLFTRIVAAVADWATSLAFNPFVWMGVLVAGASALLFAVSGVLRSRQLGGARPRGRGAGSATTTRTELPPPASGRGAPAIDDDLAEIEALLRKRGIS